MFYGTENTHLKYSLEVQLKPRKQAIELLKIQQNTFFQ